MSNNTITVQAKSGVLCKCTCGRVTNSTYAPGHDAKHVSWLLDSVLSGTYDRVAARAELPSVALQIKFDNALVKAIDKAVARQEREEAKLARKQAKQAKQVDEPKLTEVKIGRWWYPVLEAMFVGEDQFLVIYTAKDGSTKEAQVGVEKIREV